MTDTAAERQTRIDAVRRAGQLLAVAREHFLQLLSSLPPEERSQFQSETPMSVTALDGPPVTDSTALSGRVNEKWHRRPARRTRGTPTLKDTIREVVQRNSQGLTLQELIDAVMREYRSPRSGNQRHVVRTAINQLARSKSEAVVYFDEAKRRYVTCPF